MIRYALLALLILYGCATAGVQVKDEQLRGFEKGKTTLSEVEAKLGQPSAIAHNSTGLTVITYAYVHSQARPETFIPIVGAFIGGADSRSTYVALTFDQNNILTGYSNGSSQVGVATGLASGSESRVADQPRKTENVPVGGKQASTGDLAVCASLATPEVRQKCVDKVTAR